MDTEYFIRLRGRIQGPFTEEKLQAFAQRGRFSRHHEVSQDRVNWQPAAKFPQLFPKPGPAKLRAPQAAAAMELAEFEEERDEEDQLQPCSEGDDGMSGGPAQHWYYAQGGNEVGPISISELRKLVLAQQVRFDDYIWTEGLQDWVPADSVPQLRSEFAQIVVDDTLGKPYVDPVSIAVEQRTAPMAVASFVLGIFGGTLLFCLGSILAVIFGHIALSQIRHNRGVLGGRGLAIGGLILGYIVIVSTTIVGLVVACVMLMREAAV